MKVRYRWADIAACLATCAACAWLAYTFAAAL